MYFGQCPIVTLRGEIVDLYCSPQPGGIRNLLASLLSIGKRKVFPVSQKKANKWSKKWFFLVSPLEGNAASHYFNVVSYSKEGL